MTESRLGKARKDASDALEEKRKAVERKEKDEQLAKELGPLPTVEEVIGKDRSKFQEAWELTVKGAPGYKKPAIEMEQKKDQCRVKHRSRALVTPALYATHIDALIDEAFDAGYAMAEKHAQTVEMTPAEYEDQEIDRVLRLATADGHLPIDPVSLPQDLTGEDDIINPTSVMWIDPDHPQFRNAIPDRAGRCGWCGGFAPCSKEHVPIVVDFNARPETGNVCATRGTYDHFKKHGTPAIGSHVVITDGEITMRAIVRQFAGRQRLGDRLHDTSIFFELIE